MLRSSRVLVVVGVLLPVLATASSSKDARGAGTSELPSSGEAVRPSEISSNHGANLLALGSVLAVDAAVVGFAILMQDKEWGHGTAIGTSVLAGALVGGGLGTLAALVAGIRTVRTEQGIRAIALTLLPTLIVVGRSEQATWPGISPVNRACRGH